MASALVQQAWRRLARASIGLRKTSGSGGSVVRRGLAGGASSEGPSTQTPPAAAVAAGADGQGQGQQAAAAAEGRREKHKTPRRIASSLLSSVRQAEHAKMAAAHAEKAIPEFRPGDAIEVKMVTHLTSKEVDTFRGVVLGIRHNGPDSRFTLADVFLGTPLLSDIPFYSPFIKSIKVLGRAHIHKGKKRVRRAKLYYLWEKRDPKEFAISG